jgi:ABC-type transporter Mla MlaB component
MKQETYIIRKSRDDNGNSRIVIEGDMGIRNITSIKNSLASMDIRGGTVDIEITNVEKLDITTVQVLAAFKEKLIKNGCKTVITATLPGEIRTLFTKAGLSGIFN